MDDVFILRGSRTSAILPLQSLGEYFLQCLLKHGDKVAQVQEVAGGVESRTYTDLLRQGKRVANFLRENALNPGDTVLLCCMNTLEYVPVMLGTLFIGATVAPINPLFDTSDMLHLLGVIQPSIVVCNSIAQPAMTAALAQLSAAVPLVTLEAVVQQSQQDGEIPGFELGLVRDPYSDVAFVMCSSGTSGKPKGVEVTHAGVLLQLDVSLYRTEKISPSHQGVSLNIAGPFWVTCMLATLISLSRGLKLVLLSGFTVESFLITIQKYKVNFAVVGPDQVVALAKSDIVNQFDTSSLVSVAYGGATTPPAMAEATRRKLNTNMAQMYGMTEFMFVAEAAYDVTDKPGNVGQLRNNTDAMVVDLETGKPLSRNCMGELCFRTPSVMKGYRNNPEATAAIIDEDGFLHTGDVGFFDQDGFLFVRDRIKELIKYKRDHVPALDIEEVLLSHPNVVEAAVIGVFHETDWEHATGYVVLRPGTTATAQDLIALVEASLPRYKWLHGGLFFLQSLPKTATGKIQKRALRELPH